MNFPVLTPDTASPASAALLEDVKKHYGFQPNLMGVLAHAPSTLRAYLGLSKAVDASSLTPAETQTVLITTSRLNGCDYCVAAHSTVADMQRMDNEVVDALRRGEPLEDAGLEALRQLTTAVVEKRGWLDEADLQNARAAGLGPDKLLEVITAVALKTISNYTNHVANTPLDEAFAKRAYERTAPTA